MSNYQSGFTGAQIDAAVGGSVRFDVAQTKTNEQKAQAQENIGLPNVLSDIDCLSNELNAVLLNELPIKIIENECIDHSGVISSYNGWSRTDYIPIIKYKTLTASCNPASSYNMFYDREYNAVGTYFSVYATDTDIPIPDGASFVIFSNTTAGLATLVTSVTLKDEAEINIINEKLENDILTSSVVAPKNANILNPTNFTLSGYIDATDGETFVSNPNYMCTNDYIDIPFGTSKIWAKFPQIENNDRIVCFLFYDEENNHTLSSSGRFNGNDYSYAVISPNDGVSKFKFWVNKTTVNDGSNEVELSFTEPDDFESFEAKNVLNNESLETSDIYLPFVGKTIVCFGDSIFGNKRSPFGITDELTAITGAKVYNMGFGGTGMASRTSSDWDAFSMYRLAYSIANNNFSVQNAVDIDNVAGMQSYFKTSLALLKTIDFNDVDIITIAYGTNDFTGDAEIDNNNNPVDTDTFCGALRYSLQQIMTAFPHIKVFVCGQTYRFWLNENDEFVDDSDTHENGNHDKLTDFVVATKNVSSAYHVPFIDNYFDLGINFYNKGHYFPANDGTHHNYLGAKLIAEHIKHNLF